MKHPTIKLVFDRKHLSSKSKKGLVQIEINCEGKRKWIGTGVKVYSDQWNDRKRVINSNQSVLLNSQLDTQMDAISSFLLDLMKNDQCFDFEKLDDFLNKKTRSTSFIGFVENSINDRTDIEESTKKQHRTLITSLQEFGIINYMDDLTYNNIVRYDNFLHNQEIAQSTIYNYHKRMKVYIHLAIKSGMLDSDPYYGYKIDKGKYAKRKYLTEEELSKIKSCKIRNEAVLRIRDLFLFQCYTGLAYSDLAVFDFQKVEQRGTKYVIADRRVKTEEEYYIVLLSPAVEILKKYDFVLPVISNQKYNESLKVVAQFAEVDKNITTHCARHTFAVFALNNGLPIEVVSKMLGHSNIRTTQLYAKIVNKEVEKGFDKLESALSKTKK